MSTTGLAAAFNVLAKVAPSARRNVVWTKSGLTETFKAVLFVALVLLGVLFLTIIITGCDGDRGPQGEPGTSFSIMDPPVFDDEGDDEAGG
jgi:hypothetical protein